MITMTAGTSFIMWLGEQITEKGIGNGMSIIIFAGIIARMPSVLYETVKLSQTGDLNALSVLFILAFCFASIAAIVFVERSVRKIPIQYPRRMVGKNLAQAQTQYMPLKVNMSGVIPPIFASAFLVVIGAVISFSNNEYIQDFKSYLTPGNPVYVVVFVAMIIFFSFFYTALVFNPDEVAENLKKNGGFVPTVRPGKPTSDFLYSVLNRLTVWGALYISLVCILPQLVYLHFGAASFSHVFGGTAVLIVVGVTLDTYSQIQSQLIAKNYETFMSRTSKKRGGIGSMSHTRTRLLRR
jgi:preprotein translocase subunit SecY